MFEFLGYDDITLIPQFSNLKGRGECDISIEINGDKYSAPIAIAPMVTITTPEMIFSCYKNDLLPTLHRYFNSADEQYKYLFLGLHDIFTRNEDIHQQIYGFRSNNVIDFAIYKREVEHCISKVYFSVGGIKKYKEWIDNLAEKGIKRFCVDMAHGDIQECIDTCEYIKKINPENKIIAGNYVKYDAIKRNKYVDIYRVGISCGACCTTARNTGFGMPTYSSLLDCKKRKKQIIMADGGVKVNGDIAKAMAAGADIVMVGYLLAGTSCAGGKTFDENYEYIDVNKSKGKKPKFKEYAGMASKKSKNIVRMKGSIEGVSGLVDYTGFTQDVIDNMKENLKSSLAYCGARNWTEFKEKVKFSPISHNAFLEGKSRLQREK